MRWLIAITLFGCGASSSQAIGNRPDDTSRSSEDPHAAEEEHRVLCDRATALAKLGCAPFDRMDPSLLTGACSVVTSFQLAGMDLCLREQSCEALGACFDKTSAMDAPPPYRGPTAACSLPADHADLGLPAGFTREEVAQSYGRAATTYADAPSTKDQPIEVCGFAAAASWLSRMTCKDGSHPLPTRKDAERVRVGNVGAGGRCGRIIDQYQVECPEMTYDIFIDAYRCEARVRR